MRIRVWYVPYMRMVYKIVPYAYGINIYAYGTEQLYIWEIPFAVKGILQHYSQLAIASFRFHHPLLGMTTDTHVRIIPNSDCIQGYSYITIFMHS